MSRHTDTLRALFEAFNRREFEEALRRVDPDIELRPALTELDVGSHYRGRDEVRNFMQTITDVWEEYTIEAKEIIEAPDDRVLVVEHWHARGRQGIEFDFVLNDLYTFRDGLLVRIDGFPDRAEALAAAGLSEQAAARGSALRRPLESS
jgi:ketosteroid isomerase-like protein